MTSITAVHPHPRIRARLDELASGRARKRSRRLVGLGAAVLLSLGAAGLTQTPLLDVDRIEVLGSSTLNDELVRAVAAVDLDAQVLGFDTDAVRDRLLAHPRVETATVDARWNGTVEIVLTERREAAQFMTPGAALLVATDGTVLESVPARLASPHSTIPWVSGATFTALPGDTVPPELRDGLAVAAGLPSDLRVVTERVEIRTDGLGLRLVGGATIDLGDARELDAKFDAARSFIEQVHLRCLDSINVRAPLVPVLRRLESCV